MFSKRRHLEVRAGGRLIRTLDVSARRREERFSTQHTKSTILTSGANTCATISILRRGRRSLKTRSDFGWRLSGSSTAG